MNRRSFLRFLGMAPVAAPVAAMAIAETSAPAGRASIIARKVVPRGKIAGVYMRYDAPFVQSHMQAFRIARRTLNPDNSITFDVERAVDAWDAEPDHRVTA